MNASARPEALSPSFELRFSPPGRTQPALDAFRAEYASGYRHGRSRSRMVAIGAAVLLQAGLIYATFQGLGDVKVSGTLAPLMMVDVVQETKVRPEPPPPTAPRMQPPEVSTMELPELLVAPSPNPITVVAPDAKPQPPAPSRGFGNDSKAAIASYQGMLLAHLARNKQYPAAARARRQQGVALVRFSMDRRGVVTNVALAKSSGAALLDGESLDLLRRASPLPAPPTEVPGDPVELVVPIEFFIR